MICDNVEDAKLLDRRALIARFAGLAMVGGTTALAACGDDSSPSPTPTASPAAAPTPLPTAVPGPAYNATDADRLNFLLQIHYLGAAYFSQTMLGRPVSATLTSGTGVAGIVSGSRSVTLASDVLAAAMREMAYGVVARIAGLRAQLGTAATAQPAIDLSVGLAGPFTTLSPVPPVPAGSPAGTPPPAKPAFDPYASDINFLLGAWIFSGVITTAIQGMIPEMTSTASKDFAASILTSAAKSDSILRYELWARNLAQNPQPNPSLDSVIVGWSNVRDALIGNRDKDRPVGRTAPSIAADDRSVSIFRTPEQVLNIFYCVSTAQPQGGFFPAGVNGVIRYSGAATGG